jgi:hypothetical protein
MDNEWRGRLTLADGRQVRLTRLVLTHTYEGLLEGSLTTASRLIRKRLAGELAKELPGLPLVILDEGEGPLPGFRWAAAFDSHRGTKTSDPDYSSHLAVCWFSTTIPSNLEGALAAVLGRVDWDAQAEDYDIMP